MSSNTIAVAVMLACATAAACASDAPPVDAGPRPPVDAGRTPPIDTTPKRPDKLWGIDAGYVAAFERLGGTWTVDGQAVDPIVSLEEHGAKAYRLRIWVENEPGNLEPGTLDRDALTLARRAQAAGLYVVPILFMSRGWGADDSQDAPLGWGDLSLQDRAVEVEKWAKNAVLALRAEGIETRTYGVGNETDYGFCGEFEITSDVDYLRSQIWPRAATLIRATIAGIKAADPKPDLEFMLHVSRSYDAPLALGFFETMKNEGVDFSLAGLSLYPSAWGQTDYDAFEATVDQITNQLGLKIVIPEYAFPAEPRWVGWNKPIAGYAMDEVGQAAFVRDLRARVYSDSRIEGAFYWSPEEVLAAANWAVMSLFVPDDQRQSPRARAALDEL